MRGQFVQPFFGFGNAASGFFRVDCGKSAPNVGSHPAGIAADVNHRARFEQLPNRIAADVDFVLDIAFFLSFDARKTGRQPDDFLSLKLAQFVFVDKILVWVAAAEKQNRFADFPAFGF